MIQWCGNCQSRVDVISGKNELKICQACGCELSLRPVETLQTVALFQSLVDFDSGLAKYPGELANLESNLELTTEVPLDTARYLPSGVFDISANDVDLDERWHAEQLLERIIQLEQTFHVAENLIEQIPDSEVTPPSIIPAYVDKKNSGVTTIRIDSGHVATPEQIRIHNEQNGRKNASAPSSDRGLVHDHHSSSVPTRNASDSPRIRIDAGHPAELPIARPVVGAEPNSSVLLRGDAAHSEHFNDQATWSQQSRQLTCAALGTAWIIQLLIGVLVVSNSPLAIWSIWLVAETVGTICLGRIAWPLLVNAEPIPFAARPAPRFSNASGSNREKRATQATNN